MRGCGQIWPGQMRRRTDRGEHVLHEREVQHLLGGDVGDRVAPAGDGVEFLRREPLVRALLERERREQVLAHDPVLELGGLAQHVDERLAMLDDERRLGLRPSAARRQHLGEATPPGAAGRISHSGHPPRSAPRRRRRMYSSCPWRAFASNPLLGRRMPTEPAGEMTSQLTIPGAILAAIAPQHHRRIQHQNAAATDAETRSWSFLDV